MKVFVDRCCTLQVVRLMQFNVFRARQNQMRALTCWKTTRYDWLCHKIMHPESRYVDGSGRLVTGEEANC